MIVDDEAERAEAKLFMYARDINNLYESLVAATAYLHPDRTVRVEMATRSLWRIIDRYSGANQ